MRSFTLLAVLAALASQGIAQTLDLTSGFTLTRPIAAAQAAGDTTRLFLIEKNVGNVGRIRLVKNGVLQSTPFLSISPVSQGSEQGLLGLTFHPNYAQNGFLYVNYTNSAGTTVIARYQSNFNTSAGNYYSDTANASSAQVVLTVGQPFSNHNGGATHFGDDGMLYTALGDGGSGGDPQNHGQRRNSLLGKVLRLDISGDDFPADPNRNYRIPTDNPFVGQSGILPEIWSYGLRNPWKTSPDSVRLNGFGGWTIPDVGQSEREEINYEPPKTGGLNYGWKVYEGTRENDLTAGTGPFIFPVHEYDHTNGCSISSGPIYRGVRLGPDFWGHVFFSDFCDGWLEILPLNFDLETGAATAGTPTRLTFPLVAGAYGIDADSTGELWLGNSGSSTIRRIINSTEFPAVSGTVTLQDCAPAAWPRGVNLRFLNATTGALLRNLQVGIGPSGTFRIPAYVGPLRLQAQVGTWLSESVLINTAGPTDLTGIQLSLTNGDVNGDNEVGPADFALLAAAFGTFIGDTNYARNADLNRDGEVGPSDFAILAASFGQFGN